MRILFFLLLLAISAIASNGDIDSAIECEKVSVGACGEVGNLTILWAKFIIFWSANIFTSMSFGEVLGLILLIKEFLGAVLPVQKRGGR